MPRTTERKPPSRVAHDVATAFSDAQRTAAAHPRANKLLLSAFKADPKPFLVSFINAINRVLLVFSRDVAVERLVTFISTFAAMHTSDTGNFCAMILTYLITHSNAKGRAVRFRCTQLIASVLHQLPEAAEISDDIWDPLQQSILQRSQDKIPRVRAAAAGALCRLQTTADEDDEFCARLVEMLQKDSSAAVRKAALQAVAISKFTSNAVVARTRDINAEVRKVAYETLANKISPMDLQLEQRISILSRGLKERDATVKAVCTDTLLLDGWLEGACQGHVFDLVELLGCPDNEDEILRALTVVFQSERSQEYVNAIKININNMTGPDVLLLRSMSNCKQGEEFIEKFLSTTSLYGEVLRYYAVSDFASKHLLELCSSIDLSDEVGRKSVEEIIKKDFLSSNQVSEETVGSAVRALRRIMRDEEATTRLIVEIVQELLQDEIDVDDPKQTLVDKRWAEVRALSICFEVLQITTQGATSQSPLNSICQSLMTEAVLPQIVSEDEQKRIRAVQCLGLFCLIDGSGTEARTQAPLFIRASANDVPEIQELALRTLVDFLMVFDFAKTASTTTPRNVRKSHEPLSDKSNSSDSASDGDYDAEVSSSKKGFGFSSLAEECINILSQNMTNADGMIRTIAVEGLARLLFVRRIGPNATLLSRLLIVHHNPSTEDDDTLRQCLSVFFPAFSMSSPQNRIAFEEAFKPTCRTIASAPPKSPLSTISLLQVAQFIIQLTHPANTMPQNEKPAGNTSGLSADQTHERMAEVVLHEIIDTANDGEIDLCRTYAKILSSFRLKESLENQNHLERIRKLAKIASQDAEDKRVKTALSKFIERMEECLNRIERPPRVTESPKVENSEMTNEETN